LVAADVLGDLSKSALEFLKLAPRYLVSVALICGLLLFLPQPWLTQIGLQGFADAYRQWLGLAFLVSAVLAGVGLGTAGWNWLRLKLRKRKIALNIIRKLNTLTEDEKQILRYYVSQNTRANTLKVDDGVVQELVACRIIYRSADMGNLLEGFAHNISDLAWDYLHVHPQVLEGTTNYYRTDKRDRGW